MRLKWGREDVDLQRLLAQSALVRDHLGPFRNHLQQAKQSLEQVATFWAASMYVMLRQREMHPEWILVQHETLSADPLTEYQNLYAALDFPWTEQVEAWLEDSTQQANVGSKPVRTASNKTP